MKITRFKTLFFLISACFLASIIKAFSVEMLSAKRYKLIYTNQIQPTIIKKGKRGLIFDSRGKILAENSFLYYMFVDPKYYLKNNDYQNPKFFNFIDKIFNVNIKKIISGNPEKQYINLGLIPAKYFYYIKANMPLGFGLKKKLKRYYPYKNTISHIIGFVNENSNGVVGVEKQYNMYLQPQKIFERVSLT
ncbi:MAG: hypothetical protein ACPLXO_04075, partial [Desulfurella sp.]